MTHDEAVKAGEIQDCKNASLRWMENNFYPQWQEVYKNYFCERDPEKDDRGQVDETQTSIGMPDTHGYVRRMGARITAQIPRLGFHSRDTAASETIGPTLMYQWDRGVQRLQKKHVTQALIFGWSVRPWHFAVEEYQRRKRVDPLGPLDPHTVEQIFATYGHELPPVKQFMVLPPNEQKALMVELLSRHARGKLLPVEYLYTAYQGPKTDWLFVGDCYPQPNFQSLQQQEYFIVERRRNLQWMRQIAHDIPEFRDGLEKYVRDRPHGSPRGMSNDQESTTLRYQLESALDRLTEDEQDYGNQKYGREWIFSEMWTTGHNPTVKMIGEDNHWIGQIPSPYDLDGMIPFTDLVFIDDLLCGVGNSTARVMRGVQSLHNRQVCVRTDLAHNIMRPLIGTTNSELYANPDLVKRGKGFRVVKMRGPGDMWVQGEQAAMAAVAVGLQDESGIMRTWQIGTGESNMSMGANVDAQQGRTATGAKLMAFNQDVLTKDATDMFNFSIAADAHMMYLLNRSELSDPIDFDAAQYNRAYSSSVSRQREQWIKAEPLMFQVDGEITSEIGSTLADDDESNVAQAHNLFGMFNGHPGINQETLRDTVLIAHGKGPELQKWAAAPMPPPEPEIKTSVSVSVKWEMLGEDEQRVLMEKAGIAPPMPPPGMGPGGPPPGPPGMPPGEPPMSALAAASGPIGTGLPQ